MTGGTVISLEILVIEMGNRGSKSVKVNFTVKEQRVDGSSIALYYCKVYSSRRETRFLTFLSN